MLTGKCKEDFEAWSISYMGKHFAGLFQKYYTQDSLKVGAYLDFFEDHGFKIYLRPAVNGWTIFVDFSENKCWAYHSFETNTKSHLLAIEQAGVKYNEIH